jgi:hypothetical protein
VSRLIAFATAACVLALLAGPAAAATPNAHARKLLTRCENAVAAVPIVVLKAHSPQVPQANRRASAAFHRCGTNSAWNRLTVKYPKNKAVQDAFHAWLGLATGIGDYLTYCHDVAFGHTGKNVFHRAHFEIKRARKAARHARAEL